MIRDTESWFRSTGQMAVTEPNKRWLAFYAGMQLEELSEKFELIQCLHFFSVHMKNLAKELRKGDYDDAVWEAFLANPKAFLDSDGDLIWVTIGAATASGADLGNAYVSIDEANWDKEFPDGTFHLDETGKVLKPEGWQPPDLTPFIHPSLQKDSE